MLFTWMKVRDPGGSLRRPSMVEKAAAIRQRLGLLVQTELCTRVRNKTCAAGLGLNPSSNKKSGRMAVPTYPVFQVSRRDLCRWK
jgi:hypothetical protein